MTVTKHPIVPAVVVFRLLKLAVFCVVTLLQNCNHNVFYLTKLCDGYNFSVLVFICMCV